MRNKYSLFILLFVLNVFSSFGQLWLHFPIGSNNANGVDVGDLDVTGNTITIEALVCTEYSTTNYYDIATKHTNNSDCNYYFRTSDFGIRTTTGFVSLLNPRQLCKDSTYHIAGTYDGDTIKYYVNGTKVASQHWTGTLYQNNLITSIGNISNNSGYFEQFIGYLDEVRIWSVARSQQEIISNMYNLPIPSTQIGLKAYYKLGSGYSNLQGNTNWNGVLVGSQTTQVTNPYFNGAINNHFCCSVNPISSIVIAGGNTIICSGDSVLLSGNLASSYLWSNGATSQSIYAKNPGQYVLTISNSSGCEGVSNPVQITLSNAFATISIVGDTILCAGDSVKLEANSGVSYQWSNGSTTQNIYTATSGNYNVAVSNLSGCTAISQTVQVFNDNFVATLSLNGGDSVLCSGDSVMLIANSGLQYNWSNGATTQSIYTSLPNTYTVTVTGSNCTSKSHPQNIILSIPVAMVSLTGDSVFCDGDSIYLSSSVGSTYLWSNGSVNQSFYTKIGGDYYATITDTAGCSAVSNHINTVVSKPVSVITLIGGDSIICPGDSIQLVANSGLHYLWSNGSAFQSMTISAAGNYQVTVTNSDNCSAISLMQIITLSNPIALISSSNNGVICNDDTITLIATIGTEYLWSDGSTNSSIKVNLGGQYSVTINDINGCSASDTITILQSNISVSAIAQTNTSFCDGDSCLLIVSGNGNYVWSNGESDSLFYTKAAGAYFATATNSFGCSVISNLINITVNPFPIINYTMDSIIDCDSYQIQFNNSTIAENNAVYYWDFGDGITSNDFFAIHNYMANGSFNVQLTVTSPFGCIANKLETIQTNNYLYPKAFFNATSSNSSYLDDHYNFNNLSTNAVNFLWNFGDGTFSNAINPTHKYESSGSYQVQLIAYLSSTCIDTFNLEYNVFLWEMPNAFTPNEDGLNDQFPGISLLREMTNFELDIFNRWGEPIFISNEVENNFKGYNQDGKLCPEGTYLYLISFESPTKFKLRKNGFFTLIR